MKTTKLILLSFFLISYSIHKTYAQGGAIELMRAGQADANKLVSAYMKPLTDGFAASMSNGWFNTAKPHGLGGFDITGTFNFVGIDNGMKTFDAATIGLNTDINKPRLQITNPNGTAISQTVYGANQKDPSKVSIVQNFMGYDTVVSSFSMPTGLGLKYGIGLINVQAAIGLGMGTEVMIRVTPSIKTDNFTINMFGFGLKHNLSHWIWKGNAKPPIDLSLVCGYNTLQGNYNLNGSYLAPEGAYPGALSLSDYKNSQQMNFTGKGFMYGAVVSRKISFLTLYAGATYVANSVEMKMTGKYPITFFETDQTSSNFGQKIILNMEDPVTLKSELNFMKLTGGIRLKLGIFTLSGEYNYGKVNTLSAGLGINIQSLAPFKI